MVPDFKRNLLILIICRLVLISVVLGVAIFALPKQFSFFQFLQPFVLAVYGLSVLYVLLWQYSNRANLLYYVQFSFDLILISTLIFISGGINSLFTSFYVLIIVYASLLKHRQGGIEALTLSIISYSGIVHLSVLGWVPGEYDIGPYLFVVYRISLNTLGFMGVAMLGIYLSERLQTARQELGTARVVHQSIVNSLRDGLLTLDEKGRVTSCNRAAEEITAYKEQELLATPVSSVLPDWVLQRILNSDFQSSSRALHIECWTKNREGEPLFLAISCSPLLSYGQEQIGYILAFQDLTEVKRLEEEAQFKEKMAAIGEMAAGLAHEIRNPLGSLSGSLQILKSELQLSDEKARLADIILRECERLNKIVGDFLAYAGPRPSNRQRVNLLSLIQETIELFKHSPEFQNDHHIAIIPPDKDAYCVADSDQIRQVIWNILQNGTRAMPNGGTFSIRLQKEDSRVRMSFRDQGMGMSSDQKKTLFQPFFSGFKKGAGFGMAIVYQIIEQHGGSIDIESEPGQGTVVNISLPVEPAEARATEASPLSH